MPNQLQPLVDEINTCAAFQDPELKQQAVDFINLLVNPNQVVLQRNLRLVDDLTPDQEACLVTALRRALKLNNNTVKGNAAEALRNLPDVAGSAVPDLVGLLDPATEAGVRLRAAVAVAEIGPADADCLPQLITHLTDPDPDIQKPVIVAISKLGSEAAAAFEPLKAIFPADDEAVNEALISAFGELGRRAAPIAPNLAHYLQPGNSNPIRRATARSLEQLGIIPDEAIPHLVAGLQPEEEYDLRTAFLGALQQSTLASDQFVAQLAPFADDESLGPDIIKLLVRINSQAGVAVL
ncbi:MAG: HEAT repeat domain-containing protein, partial [Anaerolineae bacterium]